MPRHILAAVVPGPRAAQVLARAAMLARAHGARLSVTSVLRHAVALPGFARTGWDQAAQDLAEALTPALAAAGIEGTPLIREGSPAREIDALAAKLGADLLVIGPNEQRNLGARLIGTTADRLLRSGHRPVLMVRRRALQDYCGVVVGVDHSNCSHVATETAARLCPGVPLQLAHVTDLPADLEQALLLAGTSGAELSRWRADLRHRALAELQDFAQQWPGSQARVFVGPTEQVLARLTRTKGVDLLVLGIRGKGMVAAGLLGSVAQKVSRDARSDVLVVPEPC